MDVKVIDKAGEGHKVWNVDLEEIKTCRQAENRPLEMSLLLCDLSLDTITNPLNMSQSLDKHESMQSLKLTSHDSADAFYALYPLYYLDNQLVPHPSVGYDAH